MATTTRGSQDARAWLTLVTAAILALALLAGLLYAIATTLRGSRSVAADTASPPTSSAGPATSPTPSGSAREDELAQRPMLALAPSAADPQPLVSAVAGAPVRLPSPTRTVGDLASGFPHTSVGALAALAAIDSMALRDLRPAQVRQVYSWAALPGAVSLKDWRMNLAAEAALEGAGVPEGSSDLQSTFTPLAVQVKGHVGRDFVVACVLGEWSLTYRSNARAGIGDCQRMVWSRGRWRIGPGEQPASAPSAWPGSADAVRAGWRSVAHDQ